MTIYDLLSRGQFLFSGSGGKREAILEMVEAAARAGFVKDKSELERSILERSPSSARGWASESRCRTRD
jgi:mannitol/fructose-specific phosphotransferase system IIA component (Ntr-type)